MTNEQIKEKLVYGDYQTLGKALGITAEAAKMRYFRGGVKERNILIEIIESREKILSTHTSIKSEVL
jgi:hypothetical protein